MLRVIFFLSIFCHIAAARPNIVLFLTDDQSPIAGCYGYSAIKTPHMDALANDGIRFTNAYATTASCSPSRSVIFTGLHHHANGQYGLAHDYHFFKSYTSCASLSLPRQMAAAGYRTAHIGKLHVTPESVFGFAQNLPLIGGGHQTEKWVRNCMPLLEEKSDAPFFLAFCTIDPHRSAEEQTSVPEKLKPNCFGNPPTGETYPEIPEEIYDPQKVSVPAFLPDTIECRRELAEYYQSITRTDRALGALIAALKKTGHYDNTLIIFTSDHGMPFPGAKTTAYDDGLRVPMIVRAPGDMQRGKTNDAMISHLDLTPTILDFAEAYDSAKRAPKKLLPTTKPGIGENGGKPFTKYHGRSWKKILTTENPIGWDQIEASQTFHEVTMYYPMRTIRTRKHKLIWNIAHELPFPFARDLWSASAWQAQREIGNHAAYGKRTVESYNMRPEFELYDITNDPSESNNLAQNPAHSAVLEQLKTQIKKMQNNTSDPWILKWQHE